MICAWIEIDVQSVTVDIEIKDFQNIIDVMKLIVGQFVILFPIDVYGIN